MSLLMLYLMSLLHQTTTLALEDISDKGCILWVFYIKPQPTISITFIDSSCILWVFYIKPQPSSAGAQPQRSCILWVFYIKPQPLKRWKKVDNCCILWVFYIKPQHGDNFNIFHSVVSYESSTSNHNDVGGVSVVGLLYLMSLLHQTTTSRRERCASGLLYLMSLLHQTTTLVGLNLGHLLLYLMSLLHQTTTLWHCVRLDHPLYLMSLLHQTTTFGYVNTPHRRLYLMSLLHQTTTVSKSTLLNSRCILWVFYIKPQRLPRGWHARRVVSYESSTSNHNLRMSIICVR